jgi:hypothetical protein
MYASVTINAKKFSKLSLLVLALAGNAMAGNSNSTRMAVGVTVIPTLMIQAEPVKVTQDNGAASFQLAPATEHDWERIEDVHVVKASESLSKESRGSDPHGPVVVRHTYVLR